MIFAFSCSLLVGASCLYILIKSEKFRKYIRRYLRPEPPKAIIIAESFVDCHEAANLLVRKIEEYSVLGFDCEWVTHGRERNPISLLQLAAPDGVCVLIRLMKFARIEGIPDTLKDLLRNPRILKVGIVPSDDAKYLYQDYGIVVRGCLDLRYLFERNDKIPLGGLSGLAYSILGVEMDKSFTIRCSDWEAYLLTERQQIYAANDALVAVNIFKVITSGQRTYVEYYFSQWIKQIFGLISGNLESNDKRIPDYVYPYCDRKFEKVKRTDCSVKPECSIMKYIPKQKPAKPLKPSNKGFLSRQSPLYHNCFMQAPDGAALCTCDGKKAAWYVSKGLADLVSEDPFTVRLKFEPSGRAVGTVGQYYVQTKSNLCVVCGKEENCIRKNIVPHEYRKYFPKIMKDHVSHDILLLCLPCHLQSNSFDLALKYKLADTCSAPFCQGGNSKYEENRSLSAVRAAAKALSRSTNTIPSERRAVLQQRVKEHYGVEMLTNEILRDACGLQTNILNDDYDPHGMKVVEFFSFESNGGLVKLEQMWREHFLHCMKPRFMPNLWSVSHTEDRLAIRAAENRILAEELCLAGLRKFVPMLEGTNNDDWSSVNLKEL